MSYSSLQEFLIPKEETDADRRFSAATEVDDGFAYQEWPSARAKRSQSIWLWLGRILLLCIVAATSFWLGTQMTEDLSHCIRRTSEYCTLN